MVPIPSLYILIFKFVYETTCSTLKYFTSLLMMQLLSHSQSPRNPDLLYPEYTHFESGYKKTQNFGYSNLTITKNLGFFTYHYSVNG